MDLSFSKESDYYHIYNLYGLTISSQLEISELHDFSQNAIKEVHVYIQLGCCPKELKNTKIKNTYYTLAADEILFQIDNCGSFYIGYGEKIIIEPYSNANFDHIKIILLHRCFALLLFQRNRVALHGSTIIMKDKALIICGESGSGKSTISSALALSGNELFCDDLSVINLENTLTPIVELGYCDSKLNKKSLEMLNIDIGSLKIVDSIAEKYALPFKKTFFNKCYQATTIIELSVTNKEEISLVEVLGKEKIYLLFKNIFRPQLINDLGLNSIYLNKIIKLAKFAKIYELQRPKNKNTLEEEIHIIKNLQLQNI